MMVPSHAPRPIARCDFSSMKAAPKFDPSSAAPGSTPGDAWVFAVARNARARAAVREAQRQFLSNFDRCAVAHDRAILARHDAETPGARRGRVQVLEARGGGGRGGRPPVGPRR